MTKSGTNRHKETYEKTLEELHFWHFPHMFNLLMSFILKLLEVYFFKHKNKPWILKEFGILSSTEPTLRKLKIAVFYLKSWNCCGFIWKKFRQGEYPHVTLSLQHFYVAPPPHKSASCATGYLLHNLNPFQRRTQISLYTNGPFHLFLFIIIDYYYICYYYYHLNVSSDIMLSISGFLSITILQLGK